MFHFLLYRSFIDSDRWHRAGFQIINVTTLSRRLYSHFYFYCSAFGRHYGDTNRVQHVWLQGKNVLYHAATFFIILNLSTSVIYGYVMLLCLLKVKFPMRAYPSQIAMMSKIVTSLQRSQNSLLESPTGEADFLLFFRSWLCLSDLTFLTFPFWLGTGRYRY